MFFGKKLQKCNKKVKKMLIFGLECDNMLKHYSKLCKLRRI